MADTQTKNWFQRNWLWFIPTGCLTVILLGAAFVGAIVVFVFGVLKSSDVYQQAFAAAASNAEVTQALGEPIDDAWYALGSVNTTGASGDADLQIPISGSKGKATIYATAKKSSGEWDFSTLNVKLEPSGEQIDLLAPPDEE